MNDFDRFMYAEMSCILRNNFVIRTAKYVSNKIVTLGQIPKICVACCVLCCVVWCDDVCVCFGKMCVFAGLRKKESYLS